MRRHQAPHAAPLIGLLALLLLAPLAALASSPAEESRRLHAFLDALYEEELRFSPEYLTKLGRRDLQDQLDDYSEAGELAYLEWYRDSVARLGDRFDRGALDAEGQLSWDFWHFRLERLEDNWQFRKHPYVLTQVSASHTDLPQLLINYHEVASEADMLAYISRLEAFERALGQMRQRAEDAADKGIRPPRFAYDYVIGQSQELLRGAPFDTSGEDSTLWADARAKIDGLRERGVIDLERAEALQQRTREALINRVGPAYRALIAWYREDRSAAPAEARGALSLPDGKAWYANRIREYTTLDRDAKAIHALGLQEVARLREAMEAIRREVDFEGDLAAFFTFIREDERFYYANTPAGRQAIIDETRDYLARIEPHLPDYFGRLPITPLEVRRVEAFRERDGGAAFYEQGTPDGSRPGVYYMHLSDMRANNRTDLQTTAYHEGNPGHHMQVALSLENTGLPAFRRNVWYSAYGEGWALYSELLAAEMGVYDDPYMQFGRLAAEIFRAIRLVVDTGMHAMGWSQERAVQYMLENSAMPESQVRSEIERYLVWPGQALSYKMGMQHILELREQARAELGDDFDIRGFHDVVLGGGSLPLPLLSRQVEGWIERRSAR